MRYCFPPVRIMYMCMYRRRKRKMLQRKGNRNNFVCVSHCGASTGVRTFVHILHKEGLLPLLSWNKVLYCCHCHFLPSRRLTDTYPHCFGERDRGRCCEMVVQSQLFSLTVVRHPPLAFLQSRRETSEGEMTMVRFLESEQ